MNKNFYYVIIIFGLLLFISVIVLLNIRNNVEEAPKATVMDLELDLDDSYILAKRYRDEKKYRKSNTILYKIINSNESSEEQKIQSYYLLAEIYLSINQYESSINSYKKILDYKNNDRHEKKSLFMIAYIYNNYLDMYTDSQIHYNEFLDKYPSDDLVPSVEYELNQIDVVLNQINE